MTFYYSQDGVDVTFTTMQSTMILFLNNTVKKLLSLIISLLALINQITEKRFGWKAQKASET